MTFLEDFAARLRGRRLDRDLTQLELAQQVGVTKNCINMYETAKRTPNIKMASMLAQALDIRLDDLVPKARHEVKLVEGQTNIYDMLGDELHEL